MTYTHDLDAVLDYTQDWSAWLTAYSADTIASATATVTAGAATVSSVTNDDTTVTYWVSDARPGPLKVTVHITTAGGREDDRTDDFLVKDR